MNLIRIQAFLVDHFKPPELEVNSKILRMTNDKYLENKMYYFLCPFNLITGSI
jgi:hypothetical protein